MTPEIVGYASPPDQLARMADLRRGVRKARKIRRVLEAELGPAPWPRLRGLDVGCGPGTITAYLAKLSGAFVGVDVDEAALALARDRFGAANVEFRLISSPALPFAEEAFDVVVLNHVYEHVADVRKLFAEVRRVLRPAGRVYLAAAGKYQVVEPHYYLPFLSWLPPRAATAYLKLSGRGRRYDVRLLSYRRLRRLLAPFEVKEYTAAVVADAAKFAAEEALPPGRALRGALAAAVRLAPGLAPTRIFVLRKRVDASL
ncbi:MAG: class I SAM-dependent methyltransferase [Candidatus Coatesbacteria bacterium]|nr:MAG: class I SAM-dependent methyltransferase [Candidatus Coatesbacteria bacterium]